MAKLLCFDLECPKHILSEIFLLVQIQLSKSKLCCTVLPHYLVPFQTSHTFSNHTIMNFKTLHKNWSLYILICSSWILGIPPEPWGELIAISTPENIGSCFVFNFWKKLSHWWTKRFCFGTFLKILYMPWGQDQNVVKMWHLGTKSMQSWKYFGKNIEKTCLLKVIFPIASCVIVPNCLN